MKKNQLISGEKLSKVLKVSRTAVWKNIKALRELGYNIESIPARGYSLQDTPDFIYPWELEINKLSTSQIYYFQEIDSTNKYASYVSSPALILAEKQTKGQGRLDRNWISLDGGVYFSLVKKPEIDFFLLPALSLVVSVAIAEVIRKIYGCSAKIKWPNDVMIREKKMCGILVEASGEVDELEKVKIGVGINTNQKKESFPEELRSCVTTLSHELGREVDRKQLVSCAVDCIIEKIETFETNPTEIMKQWKNYSLTLGKQIEVKRVKGETIKGKALDVEDNGALILKKENGEIVNLTSGDVSLR